MKAKIKQDYLEKLYAGWLGKIIGVRHGANIEGWSYERIKDTFGEISTYPYDFKNFAADDDINGPMFFLRSLEDYTYTREITAEQMGLTLLNYVSDGHGFFWWGGYGKSTEHTAYLNLKDGIIAPMSGSVEQNGTSVAEQIGGQIFSDCWGFVTPGNPKLAAEYAEKMASVTHGGNGIYGGMFIAACVAAAFEEKDIEKVIEIGLSVIPKNSEYERMTREVAHFYHDNPEDWRKAFLYVKENFGYHLYPGNCHIIPNSAVIVLSMLYGQGDFSKTINICNMCGWDTDCNVGNVGAILGVISGLDGIDKSWIKPINDFVCASSVVGSLNIEDIPSLASYTAKIAYKIAGEEPEDKWKEALYKENKYLHFEYPGSTHAFRTENVEGPDSKILLNNTTEAAHCGDRSLKVTVAKSHLGNASRVFYKTYYVPTDFNDNRYDPEFSPILYPGQIVEFWTMIPEFVGTKVKASLYLKDRNSGCRIYSEKIELQIGEWTKLVYNIPFMKDVVIEEVGIEYIPYFNESGGYDFTMIAYIDDVKFSGNPDYSIDFSKEHIEKWNGLHQAVSQTTFLRGLWTIENGELSGSYSGEWAECYTGDHYWKDYEFEASIVPQLGSCHNISFRVQGGIRSYAVGFAQNNKLVLYKNNNGYKVLVESEFAWEKEIAYYLKVKAVGNYFTIFVNGKELLSYKDESEPYLYGQVGFSNYDGSHTHYKQYKVVGI